MANRRPFDAPSRFAFGKNWQNFLKTFNEVPLKKAQGFELMHLKTCGGGLGCHEFVFRRQSA